MIRTREIAYVLNGSAIGLNSETAEFLRETAKVLPQNELHIFIHLWDFWENKAYLDNFEQYFFECDNIILHKEIEAYNSEEAWLIQQNFVKALTGKTPKVIPHTVGKRVWYWYSLCKALKLAKEYSEDLWVCTLYPNSRPNNKSKEGWLNFLVAWYTGVINTQRIVGSPKFARADINDMLFTNHASKEMIKEQFLQGDIKTFEKLLEGFNIQNLMEVQSEMYTKYRVDAKVSKPKDNDVLMGLLNNTKVYPNEASVFLNNFYYRNLDPDKNFIMHYSSFYQYIYTSNPWFTITEDAITCMVPWRILEQPKSRHNNEAVYLFWTPSNQKLSDKLKDNTLNFARKNKK